jgi:hypothetical protein
MKLLKHIIEKKIDSYNNYLIKKHYPRAFWQFYQALSICLAVSKIYDLNCTLTKKEINSRNIIYNEMIYNRKMTEINFKLITKFISNDFKIIFSTLEYIDKLNESSEANVSDIERDQFIGVLACEVENL